MITRKVHLPQVDVDSIEDSYKCFIIDTCRSRGGVGGKSRARRVACKVPPSLRGGHSSVGPSGDHSAYR